MKRFSRLDLKATCSPSVGFAWICVLLCLFSLDLSPKRVSDSNRLPCRGDLYLSAFYGYLDGTKYATWILASSYKHTFKSANWNGNGFVINIEEHYDLRPVRCTCRKHAEVGIRFVQSFILVSCVALVDVVPQFRNYTAKSEMSSI